MVFAACKNARRSPILKQRNCNALRAFYGSAPVTKRSATICVVVRRRAVNNRLQTALYHWTRVALQNDRVSRAKYNTLRARGHRHARALRGVADSLLKVTCVMLENQQLFDHDYPKHELAV